MPNSENLEPTPAIIGKWYFDPADSTYKNLLSQEQIAGSMIAGIPPSLWQTTINNTALLMQLWDKIVSPNNPQLIAFTGTVGGSNSTILTERVSLVEFNLFAIPNGATRQPGFPDRHPHIGDAALIYPSPIGGYGLGETIYLTFPRQILHPKHPDCVGVYWRFNRGYTGTFRLYDASALHTGIVYQYGGGPEQTCNPYDGRVAQIEPG